MEIIAICVTVGMLVAVIFLATGIILGRISKKGDDDAGTDA